MAKQGSNLNESCSFGNIARSCTKYGTTSKITLEPDCFMKHNITSTDTLQGIALKYGTTTEVLRRANQIWANDNIHVMEYLLIPVQKNQTPNGDSSDSGVSVSNWCENTVINEVLHKDEVIKLKKFPRSASVGAQLTDNLCKERASAQDFLSKFDSSLRSIKSNIKRLEENSNFPIDESNPLMHHPRRQCSRSLNLQSSEPDLIFSSQPDFAVNRQYQRL